MKWTAPVLPATCERRKEPADETKAVERPVIDRICTRRDVPLRERLLWRMLYETASESGPLFCAERRPGPARRAATPRRDQCPETGRMRLGYDRARTLIKHHTGLRLHQLRSAATQFGEGSSVIMAKTHHRSIRTAARYIKPGLAAVTKATERLDPPRRQG